MEQRTRRLAWMAMLGLGLSVGLAHAADVFSYAGWWAQPGLRMPMPQAVLSDGTMLAAESLGGSTTPVYAGTPEAGVTREASIATAPVYEMKPGGGGVWVRGPASMDRYGADLSPVGSVTPDGDVNVQDEACDGQGRLYLLDETWTGTQVDVYGTDGTHLGVWSLTLTWSAWRARAMCFDATGRLCILVTHGTAYSVEAYDLTAGPTQPAAPVEVATGSLDAWSTGQSAYDLVLARMAATPGGAGGFIVASVSQAGGALLSISASATTVLYQASLWYQCWQVVADTTRGKVWAIADGLYSIDGPASCTYIGARGFDSPTNGLADVADIAASSTGFVAYDSGNARTTFFDTSGKATSHYDLWLPEGQIAMKADGTALYAVGLGADGGLARLDVGTWQITSLPWPAADWMGTTATHLWIVPPDATVVAVCLDPSTGTEVRRADLGLAPADTADISVASDESAMAALTTDSHVVLFDSGGLQVREWALPAGMAGRRISFAGTDEIAVACVGADGLYVIGYDLQGTGIWQVELPSNLPSNPWHVPNQYWPNEIGGLTCDPAGQKLYVVDNLHGVVHSLVRGQTGLDGDVNGDGVVNLDDLTALSQQWMDGQRDPYHPQTEGTSTIDADVNGDGRLDHEDAEALIEKLLKNGTL